MEYNRQKAGSVFEQIIAQSQQAYFIYQAGAGFGYLNEAVETLFGRSRESFQADADFLVRMLHGDDRAYVAEIYRQLLIEGGSKRLEFRILPEGGGEKWLCLTAYLLTGRGDSLPLLAGVIEDITRHKTYEYTLLKYNAKKDSTLEILSHDLASPMNMLQGLAQLVAKRIEPYGDYKLQEALRLMQSTCEKGVALIRDFVAQEFLESANVEGSKQRVDLVQKIGAVIENYQSEQQQIAKTFQLVTNREKIFVQLDDLKFMQVLNNLISNAIKFTPDGGVITTRIEEKASADGRSDEGSGTVLVAVQDNGIGIPKQHQAGLFERFTKARRPGLKGEKSTGLGMSIIKTIVEWHGGKIWFESEEHKGTTFFIELPK